MTLIDQRILIDAPPQVVWDYISDPARLTSWNTGYTSVSVLTTQQTGPGTRRRCTPANGKKDVIEEITHWVDGWGYEYTIVDGGPYRHYQGRLRLQAVPDGTSVQWIVSYRPKGPLGLIRDRFSGRRAVMAMMATSLRQLRRRIDELGVRMDDDTRARVGMQGRLNADERAHYQRRYAPPPGLESPEGALAGEPAADQPVPLPGAPVEIPTGPVPSFVAGLTSGPDEPDYSSTADTEPRAPKGLREAIHAQQDSAPLPGAAAQGVPLQDIAPPEGAPSISASQQAPPQDSAPQEVPPPPTITPPVERAPLAKPPAEEESRSPFAPPIAPPAVPPAEPAAPDALPDYRRAVPPAEPAAPDALPDYRRPTPPRGIPSVKRAAEDSPLPEETSKPPRVVTAPPGAPLAAPVLPADMPPVEPPSLRTAQEMPPVRRPDLPPPTPATDTGEMSIWEVFGMTRPSEQDTAALNDLIHSVETRKKKNARHARRCRAKHPVRVRQVPAAIGLRLRLQMMRVRWEHKAR